MKDLKRDSVCSLETLEGGDKKEFAQLTEEIKEVQVDPIKEKTTRVSTSLLPEVKCNLVSFLRRNIDVFAWMPTDMLGTPSEVITHQLSVNKK